MPDDAGNPISRLNAAMTNGKLAPAKVTPDRLSQQRRTGTLFQRGDVVIDAVTGQRARVHSARPSTTGAGPVYEIVFTSGGNAARLERELELDPTPPTTRGA